MAGNETLRRSHGLSTTPSFRINSHWLLLIASGFAWGATFSLAKIATQGDIHPLSLNFWQTFFGCAALLGYAAVRRRRLPTTKIHIRFYLIAGILGTVIPGVLYFVAARELPAGILAITIATVPMLTLAISRALGSERLSFARILGLSLGVIGIVFILVPDTSLPKPSAAPFVVLAVFCALCYAFENVYIDFHMPGGEALTILCGMLAMASLITALITIAPGWATWTWV